MILGANGRKEPDGESRLENLQADGLKPSIQRIAKQPRVPPDEA